MLFYFVQLQVPKPIDFTHFKCFLLARIVIKEIPTQSIMTLIINQGILLKKSDYVIYIN